MKKRKSSGESGEELETEIIELMITLTLSLTGVDFYSAK